MISSGIKRGLAATAVSALAVAGLPFLASSASATPIATQVGNADGVEFYSQIVPGISAKNDGTNTTVSLVTGGGANVTSVAYQYTTAAAPATWVDVPGGLVARNADGVFAVDWSGVPANVTQIRAVPNTGLANAVVVNAPTITDAAANTVELASEGSLGVFQAPYGAGHDGDYVGVTGTVSQGSGAPNVTDASSGTTGADITTLETTTSTTSDTFNSVLDINAYPYSAGSEPNQIAINAATNNTDDAEGSTLYVQTIGSITATPTTQDQVNPANASITLTVLDTQGKPVAGAQVYRGSADTDTDGGAGPDTDTDGPETLVGYTDGRGQVTDTTTTGATTYGYYVNTTGNTGYEPSVDKATTATVTTYTPAFTTITIKNERSRTNFDIDELSDADDFTIVTADQKGAPISGVPVDYRYIIDPSGAGATYTSPYTSTVSDANGKVAVPGLTETSYNGAPVPPGTYTIEARRPNVGGTGLTNATPVTVNESESEISYSEGASANAPVNGDFTVTGNLANTDGNLAGRLVSFTYASGVGGDATTAPQSAQPAGTTITAPGSGTAITDANGNFSVVLRDQGVPPNVTPTPESGTFTATATGEAASDATSLKGNLGTDGDTEAASAPNAPANASQALTVNFAQPATVTSIDVNLDEIYGAAAPGRPVDLDVVVHGADGDNNPNNDPALQDYPVTITVDKGFLSPNAETAQDVTLASGHDSTGDLWGFFKNDGTSKSVSTGDSSQAGAVAAIERDPGFDDDGLVDMVVTVKAGNTTVTRTITFDDRNMLNQGASTLERAAGAPQGDVPVGQEVPFQLYVHDQYGNLVGDQLARISDDSTVADFRTDESFDQTLSDFTTNGPGIVAFSDAPAVQTLAAAMSPGEVLVDANDDPDANSKNVSVKADPINWVKEETTKVSAELTLKGYSEKKVDVLFANADSQTAGAQVKLFKKVNGAWKRIAVGTMNSLGNHHFRVADKNGKKVTKYKAVVSATAKTYKGEGTKGLR